MAWWEYVMVVGALGGIVVGVCLVPLVVLVFIGAAGSAWRGKP